MKVWLAPELTTVAPEGVIVPLAPALAVMVYVTPETGLRVKVALIV